MNITRAIAVLVLINSVGLQALSADVDQQPPRPAATSVWAPKPLKTPAARVLVVAPKDSLERLAEIEIDLRAAGLIGVLETAEGDFRVDVELGDITPGAPS